MSSLVTVAIPVLNAGPGFSNLLAAVASQRLSGELEVLICDSGSKDGSVQLARAYGATVIEIEQARFSHGGTRNLLMERSSGERVAFLTQDAVPTDDLWLGRLLDGFAAAADVGLVFGPYRPRPEASPMVIRELTEWFGGFSPDGAIRLDRLEVGELGISSRSLLGRRGFFTDANGCVARTAWEQVPFRAISYAEDHALAQDMMRAGYSKAFVPEAAVIHSHDYSSWGWLQRSFDEARALHELYGWKEPLHPRIVALNIWGRVGADWRWAGSGAGHPSARLETLQLLLGFGIHHLARTAGGLLGARTDRLPSALVRRLSQESRGR